MLRPYAGASSCSLPGPAPVPALLVGYNGHLAIYQDSVQRVTAPVRTQDAQQVLDYYADYGAETIDEYFGGVPDINGDGIVNVFVSPVVGESVAGSVWAGDFLSRDACAGSNEMELVYLNEGLLRALGSEQENTHYQALPTIAHEMKHVSSLYRRTAAGSSHPIWIEEGTAEVAAERSSRKAMEAAGGVAQEVQLTARSLPAPRRLHHQPRELRNVVRPRQDHARLHRIQQFTRQQSISGAQLLRQLVALPPVPR